MSESISRLVVVLDADYSLESAKQISEAIGMIRGVADVEQVEHATEDWMARTRIKSDLLGKLHRTLLAVFDGKKITIEGETP